MNAQEIATQAHAGQFRRDGVTPYITHPEAVASFFNKGSMAWQVAWLHDVLEDTKWTKNDLAKAGMSDSVIVNVEWLTHRKEETYAQYIARVALSYTSKKIKIADIFVNLSDSPTDRQKEKYKKALAVLLND
jgi:(p)ppGpp synthase/HD superfamily hydrolase